MSPQRSPRSRGELDGYDAEINAIIAYENALRGRFGSRSKGPKSPKTGTLKQRVLAHLKDRLGLTRADLIGALGINGAHGKEQRLSNLLSSLTRTEVVKRVDRKYTLV
jgi:hypothetical protein